MSEPCIAIIGAGNIGGALATRFSSLGLRIVFGVRKPESVEPLLASLPRALALAPPKAVQQAEIIFLAVPGGAAVEVAAGLGDLEGKILVDCTNPLRWDAGPVWTPPEEGSVAAAISARCPGARVVKAFNTFGSEFHGDPSLGADRVEVLMASDDQSAKDKLAELAESAGFAAIDAGPLRNASLLENHALLWIHLALAAGHGRDFVFKMVRKPSKT